MSNPGQVEELVRLASAAPARCGPVRLIAVDGGAAAGKTTLAGRLAAALPGSSVLHLDDLLAGWAGQFDFAGRLRRDVLEPLAAGRPGRYRRYDWPAGRFAEEVPVAVPDVLVVEGVSAIDACAGRLSLGIFIAVDRAVRERRWIARDGPMQPAWRAWLDAEDRYFAEHPLPAGTVLVAR